MQIPAALVDALTAAPSVCVLTGAGVSAESGVPTFRDARHGLWAKYDPLELATPEAFARNPALVWRWYAWRRRLVSGVEPNAGHRALAKLQALLPAVTLVTQNVDGLHQRAGSRDVIEFHGNLFVDRCVDEGVDVDVAANGEPPACPRCGALVRPGVVWFGEMIPADALERAFDAADSCNVFLSVGTSSLVYPAAGLVDNARAAGAVTVEVNPKSTERSSSFDFVLRAGAAEALPKLLDSIQRHR